MASHFKYVPTESCRGGFPLHDRFHRLAALLLTATLLLVSISSSNAFDSYRWQRYAVLQQVKDNPTAAIDGFIELAANARNDYQASDALEQAAMLALAGKDFNRALALAGKIPLPSHAAAVRLRILASGEKWQQITDEFATTDFSDGPPSLAAVAYHIRGRAFLQAGDKNRAESDFIAAARRSDKVQVFFDLGNIAMELGNDVIAADAFLNAQRAMDSPSGWQYYATIRSRAAILRRNGFYEYALQELDKAGDGTGFTHISILIDRAGILTAMGRTDEAVELYKHALTIDGIYTIQENTINAELGKLGNRR